MTRAGRAIGFSKVTEIQVREPFLDLVELRWTALGRQHLEDLHVLAHGDKAKRDDSGQRRLTEQTQGEENELQKCKSDKMGRLEREIYGLPLVYSCLETLWEGESEGEMDGAFERTRDFVGELGPSAYISLLGPLGPSFDLPDLGDSKL